MQSHVVYVLLGAKHTRNGTQPGDWEPQKVLPARLKDPAVGPAIVKSLCQMNRDPSLVTIAIHTEKSH